MNAFTRIQCVSICLAFGTSAFGGTVHLNQVGFDQALPKTAVIEGNASLAGTNFTIGDNGKVAYTGKIGPAQSISDWSNQAYMVARFDDFRTAGTWTLSFTGDGGATSYPFVIGPTALEDATIPKVLSFFLEDRNTDAIDRTMRKYPDEGSYNVYGGWNDAAGDRGKYLSHLSYANYMNPQQTPFTVWGLAFAVDRIPAYLHSKGLLKGYQDEVLWGADFLVRMQDPAGYFYITVFDSWGREPRRICGFYGDNGIMSADYAAAFREGGGLSVAALARVSTWAVHGEKTSADYLRAAKTGYAHLKSKTVNGVCEYCDDKKENIIDDYTALMATTELYIATQDSSYLTDAKVRALSLANRIAPDGYFWSDDAKTRPFWHGSDAGLPLVALTRYLECDKAPDAKIKVAINRHLDYLMNVTKKVTNPFGYARQSYKTFKGKVIREGFFMPRDNETEYWWQGENARLGSLASAAFYAGRATRYDRTRPLGLPDSLTDFGLTQIGWVLGKNPKGLCFMQGVGSKVAAGFHPPYGAANGNYDGGIVNGITSGGGHDASRLASDGSGIAYMTGADYPTNENAYKVWHWVEQWIPHATWYLMALVTLNDEKHDSTTVSLSKPQIGISGRIQSYRIANGQLTLTLDRAAKSKLPVQLIDLHGRILAHSQINVGQTSHSFSFERSTQHGVAILVAGDTRQRVAF